MQNIQNAIGNRHVTFKIPAVPFVSNLWRTKNATLVSSSAKNSSSTPAATADEQIGVSGGVQSTAAGPIKPGGHQPGKKTKKSVLSLYKLKPTKIER
jgi:hypothetical protein